MAKAGREDPMQFQKEFPYALQSWKGRIRLSLVLLPTITVMVNNQSPKG